MSSNTDVGGIYDAPTNYINRSCLVYGHRVLSALLKSFDLMEVVIMNRLC